MAYAQFNRIFLVLFSLMVTALVAVNVILDPFGVFGTSSLPYGPQSNERYLKIDALMRREEPPELLFFASSRSGMTDPEWITERTGLTAYNLSVFSGKPEDMQLLYRAYRRFSPPPKQIVVGLDVMAFMLEPPSADLAKRHHPSVHDRGPIGYWADYLTSPSLIASLDRVVSSDEPHITFDFTKGTYALVGYERKIAENHAAYIASTFDSWRPVTGDPHLDQTQVKILIEWLDELRVDGVEPKVFLQPMHRQWKERMAALIPPVRELVLSQHGSVDLIDVASGDDTVWYEQRHYREPVARNVVQALFPERPLVVSKGR